MNFLKMLHMTPPFFLGLAFASAPLLFWSPCFTDGSSCIAGVSDILCIGVCSSPFFIAGLALLSLSIQGTRESLEIYVEPEQHAEHGSDPLTNTQSGTWFPSAATVHASHPDGSTSKAATNDSEASTSTTPSDEEATASNPALAKDANEAGGVFWDTTPVDED